MKLNQLFNVDCWEGLKQMIAENQQIDCVITSPPYWSLRDYGIEPSIWDGDPNCEHNFKENEEVVRFNNTGWKSKNDIICPENELHNYKKRGDSFCSKCKAWKGPLGLEPNFELYLKHLCDIYDLIWEVLKPTGTNWVNLGDTYGGSSLGKSYAKHKKGPNAILTDKQMYSMPKVGHSRGKYDKCLLMIPQRFAIEMINRGWILRNVIIWHKPNAMPSSARDRFTIDFEYIYFFVKTSKTQYWINEKTAQLVSKKPLGRKGIENIDWEWRECSKCLGTGIKHKKCKYCEEEGWVYNILLQPEKCQYCKGLGRIEKDSKCKSCKGNGIKKYNFWKGKDYWFEQLREPLSDNPATKERYKYKVGNQTNRKDNGVDKVKPGKVFSKYFPQDLPSKNETYPILQYTEKELTQITKKKSGWVKQRAKGIDNITPYQTVGAGKWAKPNIIPNLLGKNKRCVWIIPTSPNPEAHFAAFPPKLVEPMILAGCPEFVCKKCGKPRERIIDEKIIKQIKQSNNIRYKVGNGKGSIGNVYNIPHKIKQAKFIGFSNCGCNKGFRPGIVLDPFAGTGTALKKAWKLGRNYIGFEISEKYCEIAEKQLSRTRFKRLEAFI